MERLKFSLGDTAYLFLSGKKVEGKVIHMFEFSGETQYVLEVKTAVDSSLEVRDGFSLSDIKSKPIGLFRVSKKGISVSDAQP